MPAARMGDMCVCCGPPDTIAMGEPTVQINDGGGMVMIGGGGGLTMIGGGGGMTVIGGGMASGGGGGGGAGGPGGKAAMLSAAAATALQPEETELREPFFAAQFTDGAEAKQSSRRRRLTDPDGNEDDGFIAGSGTVQKSRIESEGEGEIALRMLMRARWSTEDAKIGDEVTVTASATGFEDGTPATVLIKRVSDTGADTEDVIDAEVSGEEIEATWTYESEEADAKRETYSAADTGLPWRGDAPVFTAEVVIDGHPELARTGVLVVRRTLEIEFADDEEGELPNFAHRLHTRDGVVDDTKADDAGKQDKDDVAIGRVRVFPKDEESKKEDGGST